MKIKQKLSDGFDILGARIAAAMSGTEPDTKERAAALAAVKWRLREACGLYVGLEEKAPFAAVLVSADDKRCQVYDGRDNERAKAKFFADITGGTYQPELADMQLSTSTREAA